MHQQGCGASKCSAAAEGSSLGSMELRTVACKAARCCALLLRTVLQLMCSCIATCDLTMRAGCCCRRLTDAAAADANSLNGTNLTEDEVMAQLQQMQQLSETLVQDMRQ